MHRVQRKLRWHAFDCSFSGALQVKGNDFV